MAVSYQLVIDCASPDPLAHFWAEALHYVVEPPPPGFDSWDDYYRSSASPRTSWASASTASSTPTVRGLASGSRSSPRRSRSRTASTST